MVAGTKPAATDGHSQLQALYSAKTSAQLSHMIGITAMPGIDDYGPDETFTQTDAVRVLNWVERKHIGTLSFWALQRDNGGCPGTKGAGACSRSSSRPGGSATFEPFTR